MAGGSIPKALLPVGGVPIIFRQMRALRQEGVTHVGVLAGHLADELGPALAPEAAALGLKLQIVVEDAPLGTAGRLTALNAGTEDTLLVYGDLLFDIAFTPLFRFHASKQALITIVAHPNDHPRTSDLLVEHDGLVEAILPWEKPRTDDHRNLVPAGIYLAAPAFFAKIASGVKADMINDLLPNLVGAGKRVAAYNTPEYLRDVGSPSRRARAEQDLASGRVEAIKLTNLRPALFFDCDGVLNDEPGLQGAVKPDDVKLLPGAGDAVRRTREAGHLTVAVTNRPQVAKGFITFEALDHILGRLEALVAEDRGVLDRVYFCPHHPDAGVPGEVTELKIRCECRKPGTLMLRWAFADLPIDRRRSAIIGDSLRDIGAARGAGIWAYGVRTGHGCRDQERYERETGTVAPMPDLMFDSVIEAVDFELGYKELAAPALSAIERLDRTDGEPLLIGLCGRSRAGKSVTAHAIARALNEQDVCCLQARLDDRIVPAGERESSSAEARDRVDVIPQIVQSLREGQKVRSPGCDTTNRGQDALVTYDSADFSVILLEGNFAEYAKVRDQLDLSIFVDVPLWVQRKRFISFCRWKGFDEDGIENLWRDRSADEGPGVDRQRDLADLIVMSRTR
jgi:histidinol-phosphate phosphatase family protein